MQGLSTAEPLSPEMLKEARGEGVYTAEEYAGLSRRVRRSLRKAGQAPPGTVLPATQQPRRFVDPTPKRATPTLFYWWDRPYAVAAHIFSECPRLFREWAGRDFRSIRSGPVRQAGRHTAGLCQHCLLTWEYGRVA